MIMMMIIGSVEDVVFVVADMFEEGAWPERSRMFEARRRIEKTIEEHAGETAEGERCVPVAYRVRRPSWWLVVIAIYYIVYSYCASKNTKAGK